MNVFEQTVSPSECALAVALPLTRDEFLADLRPGAEKDYAQLFWAQNWDRPSNDVLWGRYHDNFSTVFESVAGEVESLGVKVVRALKLADVPGLVGDRAVVTVISHWRGAEVGPDDFLDLAGFVDKLKASREDDVSRVRGLLSGDIAARLEESEPRRDYPPVFLKALVSELNRLIEEGNLGEGPGFGDSEAEQPLPVEQRTFRNRRKLDSAFGGLLKSGNRMEFADGMHSAEDIREQIPDDFCGLIDLIVCHSALPAEVIKSMKRECLILSNQAPANPVFRLMLYKATIQALHQRSGSYIKTMTEVRQGLGNYLKNS